MLFSVFTKKSDNAPISLKFPAATWHVCLWWRADSFEVSCSDLARASGQLDHFTALTSGAFLQRPGTYSDHYWPCHLPSMNLASNALNASNASYAYSLSALFCSNQEHIQTITDLATSQAWTFHQTRPTPREKATTATGTAPCAGACDCVCLNACLRRYIFSSKLLHLEIVWWAACPARVGQAKLPLALDKTWKEDHSHKRSQT